MSVRFRATAAVIALAAIAFLTYRHFNPYRDTVTEGPGGGPVTVLVAKKAIPKGTSEQLIATKRLYTAETLRETQVVKGAFGEFPGPVDASELRGNVTVKRIPAGQQLTAADFGLAGP